MEKDDLRKQKRGQKQKYVPIVRNEKIVASLLQVECVNHVRLSMTKNDIWERSLRLIPGCKSIVELKKGARLIGKRVLSTIQQVNTEKFGIAGIEGLKMIRLHMLNIAKSIVLIIKYIMPLKPGNLRKAYVKYAETPKYMHIMTIMINRWMFGGYVRSITG